MPLEVYVDSVELIGVIVWHPKSPAHVEFAMLDDVANMLKVLNGAGMQPPPLTYTAGANV